VLAGLGDPAEHDLGPCNLALILHPVLPFLERRDTTRLGGQGKIKSGLVSCYVTLT